MVLIKKYYAAYIATMSQGSDRAGNAIISSELQRSILYMKSFGEFVEKHYYLLYFIEKIN